MKKILITLVLAFVAGYLANEHTRADTITPVLHQVESATQAVQTDHVALERHLARRERRDEMMFTLFDRVMTIIENDAAQRKVAVEHQSHDNK